MDDFLDLDKLFDPTNGGIIEMVQLPDIFLDHPTVSVTVRNFKLGTRIKVAFRAQQLVKNIYLPVFTH